MDRIVIGCRIILSGMLLITCSTLLASENTASSKLPKHSGTLVFGFLPMESPVSLFKRFAPLREYLSTALQQEIRLETATDFSEFSLRTHQRKYDIVFTAPHMALSALDGDSYELAASFIKPLKTTFVVHRKSSLANVKDIVSLTLATPPNQAIVTMVGKEFLKKNKSKDIKYKIYRTHNAAYSAVLGGEAQVAMVSNFIAMKAINNNHPLKIIAQSDAFPGIGILVANDLQPGLKDHIRKAIWSMKELPHGNKILKKIAQPGYGKASKKDFEVLRPFVLSNIASAGR